MSKPRVFIGSSVEGLHIAYAVQQNLLHAAEVTVWDQGVFELSKTTMESLSVALESNDFAVFVFSPDDLTRIRDANQKTVRDNVLFEFGLFIGRLGRDRVFFLIPSDGELHLPTDLLGVTPGKFETNRSDGSMQAATGAASNQIRAKIKELGKHPNRVATEGSGDAPTSEAASESTWIEHFFEKRFDLAIDMLAADMARNSGEDAHAREAWLLMVRAKRDGANITPILEEFAKKHQDSSRIQRVVANILRIEGNPSKSIELLLAAKKNSPDDEVIARDLARSRIDDADAKTAIEELQRFGSDDSPSIALDLADILRREEKAQEAFDTLKRCYAKNSSHEELKYRLARAGMEIGRPAIAAYLFDGLTLIEPKSVEYWGYLGNACLELDLNDTAAQCYRRAEALIDEKSESQWIVANIGNLFLNRGLPSEAKAFLDRSLKYEPDSEYAHGRLATALGKLAEDRKEFQKKISEGRRELRELMDEDSTSLLE